MVAGKIVALFDRGAARDLFDVRRILAIEGLDRGWIKAARPGARRLQPAGLAGRIEGHHRMQFTRVSPQSRLCLPRDLFRDAGDVDA